MFLLPPPQQWSLESTGHYVNSPHLAMRLFISLAHVVMVMRNLCAFIIVSRPQLWSLRCRKSFKERFLSSYHLKFPDSLESRIQHQFLLEQSLVGGNTISFLHQVLTVKVIKLGNILTVSYIPNHWFSEARFHCAIQAGLNNNNNNTEISYVPQSPDVSWFLLIPLD